MTAPHPSPHGAAKVPWRIRIAHTPDAAAVSSLAVLTFPLACPPGTSEADIELFCRTHLTAERFTQYIASPAHTVVVVEPRAAGDSAQGDGDERAEDGQAQSRSTEAGRTRAERAQFGPPSAYALVAWQEVPTEPDAPITAPTALLSKCYVHPDAHGSGAASGLIDAVKAEARRRGRASVWLSVNQGNVRAQRFYAKHGFTVAGTTHTQVGELRHDDFIMQAPVD